MSLENRIDHLESRSNGHAKTTLVITWKEGEPDFKGKPQTRGEALDFIRTRRAVYSLPDPPRTLVIVPEGEYAWPIEEWLMQRWEIAEDEI